MVVVYSEHIESYGELETVNIDYDICDKCKKETDVMSVNSPEDEYQHFELCKKCIEELFEKYEKEKD